MQKKKPDLKPYTFKNQNQQLASSLLGRVLPSVMPGIQIGSLTTLSAAAPQILAI